jgi:hypothetical protein
MASFLFLLLRYANFNHMLFMMTIIGGGLFHVNSFINKNCFYFFFISESFELKKKKKSVGRVDQVGFILVCHYSIFRDKVDTIL